VKAVKHVLLVWELGGNRGHLERLHIAATVLKSRSIHCTFVVRNHKTSQTWLAERGWPCLQAPVSAQSNWGAKVPDCHADWYFLEGFAQPNVVRQFVADWKQLLHLTKADVALLDYAPFAAYAFHFLQIPYLILSSGFCTPHRANEPVCFQPWDSDAVQRSSVSHLLLKETFGLLKQQFGHQAPLTMDRLYTTDRVAMCVFKEMDHFSRPLDEDQYLGVIWGSKRGSGLNWKSTKQSKRLFCYLNTPSSQTATILKSLRSQSFEVIAVVPNLDIALIVQLQSQRMQLSAVAQNVEHLLNYADACITHGGLALSALSLLKGVPLLLLPRYAEQVLLSQKLKKSSLAVATTQLDNSKVIAEKVDILLIENSYKSKANEFSEKYRSCTPIITVESSLRHAQWIAE
jgi:UDP:flavonoid glycosyltransferase YjiC (YdhE family)